MCNRQAVQWLLAGAALLLAACSPVRPLADRQAAASTTPAVSATPTVDRWQEIRQWSPYPHTTPLPPQVPTPVDGIYVRFDPRTHDRPPCRRCPPYPPEGGVWKLELDEGVFRVYHPRTGWRTLGSYTVTAIASPSSTTRSATWPWDISPGSVTRKGCTLPSSTTTANSARAPRTLRRRPGKAASRPTTRPPSPATGKRRRGAIPPG